MRVRDLGELHGPVMVWGGAVSNLAALRALRMRADALEIAAGNVICTGDIAAYCAEPAECLAEVIDWGCAVIAGNCEAQLAASALDCGCGFDDGTACDLASGKWFAHASGQMTPDLRAWQAGLPDFATFRHEGRRWGVVHGGATAVNRFLWPVSADDSFMQEFNAFPGEVDAIVAGHAGIAFLRDIGPKLWLNAGAAGMPPNDGHPQTRFAILGPDGPRIERLTYDPAPSVAAMQAAGLTQGYDRALTTGLWPSEDVLPPDMRRGPRTG